MSIYKKSEKKITFFLKKISKKLNNIAVDTFLLMLKHITLKKKTNFFNLFSEGLRKYNISCFESPMITKIAPLPS